MSKLPILEGPENERASSPLIKAVDRRSFLRYTGATAVVGGLLLAGCSDDDDDPAPTPPVTLGLTLTNDDFGILNYAYALEQLEAAFYTKVATDSTSALSTAEMDIMKRIRDHEIVHRDFFKAALGDKRIKDLEVDFSSINFNDKASVLGAARAFEDLGVSAYNGAGQYISNPSYLTLAGKIVSVEARHAALIREMIAPDSAVGRVPVGGLPAVVSSTDNLATAQFKGTEISRKPRAVLAIAGTYIKPSTTIINNIVE
jgi:Ferritin-like domain